MRSGSVSGLVLGLAACAAACSSPGSDAESVTGSSTTAEGGTAVSAESGTNDAQPPIADGGPSGEASAVSEGGSVEGDAAPGEGGPPAEAGPAGSPLVGNYTCTAVTTVDLTSPPLGNYPQPNQTVGLSIVSAGPLLKATVSPPDGGAPCSLLFLASGAGGASPTLKSGQSCTVDGTAVASFTSSSESLSGNALTVQLPFNLGGTQFGFNLVGTGSESLTCTRL